MKRSLVATVALLALLSGCKKEDAGGPDLPEMDGAPVATAQTPAAPVVKHDPNEVAITVGDFKMTWGEIDQRIDGVLKQYEAQIPAEQKDKLGAIREQMTQRLVQSVVTQQALLQAAKDSNTKLTQADRDEQMKKIEEFAKSRNTTVKELLEKAPFGPEAARKELEDGWLIEKYIDNTLPKFTADEKAIDQEIANIKKLVEEKTALAKSVLKQVQDGADFGKLAEEYSDCPSGKQAKGSLGKFKRGQMVKPFEDAVASLTKPGEITKDLVKTAFGLHIIRLDGKTAEKPAEGDNPKVEESFEASHILIRIPELPTKEALIANQKAQHERQALGKLIMGLIEKLQKDQKLTTPYDEEMKAAKEAMEKAQKAAGGCSDPGCTESHDQKPAEAKAE